MATIIKAKGGNKTRNPHAREEFNKGKKIGRKKPAQVWVWDEDGKDELAIALEVEAGIKGKGHWAKEKA